ncbi:MAG: DUF1211 domain-containing protein [Ktedonobacteraceae bacterium]|nr:DUF1211 domain-containing protein [Ktedonobacteraceae bacterium]
MDEKDTDRLEAFSDGVFAVAITLLVLDIRISTVDPSGKILDNLGLWSALLGQRSTLFAFVTSFLTVGIMWLNHHRVFKHVERTDTGLLLLNLLLLFLIVFVPVPTALLGGSLGEPYEQAAAVLYSGTFFLIACSFNLLWRYASYHNRLIGKDIDQRTVAAISRQYSFGPLFYFTAFALAWISAPASTILNFMFALFFALPGPPLRRLPQ